MTVAHLLYSKSALAFFRPFCVVLLFIQAVMQTSFMTEYNQCQVASSLSSFILPEVLAAKNPFLKYVLDFKEVCWQPILPTGFEDLLLNITANQPRNWRSFPGDKTCLSTYFEEAKSDFPL